MNEAEQLINKKIRIPPGYWTTWGGQFEQMIFAAQRLQIVIPLALALIFILLYTMFGNFRDGLLMFTGVPFAFRMTPCLLQPSFSSLPSAPNRLFR